MPKGIPLWVFEKRLEQHDSKECEQVKQVSSSALITDGPGDSGQTSLPGKLWAIVLPTKSCCFLKL